MINIDINDQLSSKQAKEIQVSLNLLVKSIEKCLAEECEKNNKLSRFRIEYDMGNSFTVYARKTADGLIHTNVEYMNKIGEKFNTISLQDALMLTSQNFTTQKANQN
jgi:hypothetical protein